MKFALIMNQHSYPGREYLKAISRENISVDILSIGTYPIFSKSEDERCGGLWKPPLMTSFQEKHRIYPFESLNSGSFHDFLNSRQYDLAIQGGTGILRKNVISKFRWGILNFHPGDLPMYRGCSAPEWQLYEGNPVISTCHLIDEGIDTGAIFERRVLRANKDNYEAFRASIYPETALFVRDTLKKIIGHGGFSRPLEIQNEQNAQYRPYIGQEKIELLRKKFFE